MLTREEFRLILKEFERAKDTIIALQDKNVEAYNRMESTQDRMMQQLSEDETRLTNLETNLWHLRRDLNTCIAHTSEKPATVSSAPPPPLIPSSVTVPAIWVYVVVPILFSVVIIIGILLCYYKVF